MYYDYITEFIFREDHPKQADMIMIPGSGYGELAIRAAELYREGYAGTVVVSGGHSILKGHFEGPVSPEKYVGRRFSTECDFLTCVLEEEGVPREHILQEKCAGFTYENAIHIRELLEENGMIQDGDREPESVLLVCQAFHAMRSLLYFQLVFPRTKFLLCPAVTQGISRENWQESQAGRETVLGELQRIGRQFGGILAGTDTVWKRKPAGAEHSDAQPQRDDDMSDKSKNQ